ncbi:FAD-binding protein [Legionella impletisoli]|uniref:FAD-binding PCMH-type domain-containing protein n=1 Tax=Legionella impletisoli TaxID=343510 RepID=A0A917NBL8_9GAMM|nr:FAD-binding protein [Legionella impletisoli]GGI81214.1 hypothetical protein GCM10007966_07130 [Legionella impletisoli]
MAKYQWNQALLRQCEERTGQRLLEDSNAVTQANQDFGRLTQGEAVAVFKPFNISGLQSLLQFANHHQLPITIRANGFGQSGQSLAPNGSVIVDIAHLEEHVYWRGHQLIAGCSATWKSVVAKALTQNQLPIVIPYNTNLTLGGVLSVGGVGSASFKEGISAAHIEELLVLTAEGELIRCDHHSNADLFNACLGGAGLFGVIIEAALKTRPCQNQVRVFRFVYEDRHVWLNDQFVLKQHGDYLEAFVTDNANQTKKKAFIINLAMEYEQEPLEHIPQLNASFREDVIDLSLKDYTNRHDTRIQSMKDSGAWDYSHPWYECYVDRFLLESKLAEIMDILDDSIGGIYHIFPIAPVAPKYFMLPESENIVTLNVLPPGIKEQDCKKVIQALLKIDDILISIGGKRYISGWFYSDLDSDYWINHYGRSYALRKAVKMKYDPNQIFCSKLFPEI